jgi:phospholipase C
MTYTVRHTCIEENFTVDVTIKNGFATVHCSASDKFHVQFPGKVQISKSAAYNLKVIPKEDDAPVSKNENGTTGHTSIVYLPLTMDWIKKPDGTLFTSDHITLDDLNEFRDLRGTSQGKWSFSLHGESDPIRLSRGQFMAVVTAIPNSGYINITVDETVTSQSAPPLVSDTLGRLDARRYEFDLFRIGMFTATASERRMVLVDPDGITVATDESSLKFPVTLETIDKSRDAEGTIRPWSLQVFPSIEPGGPFGDEETAVWASVIESARIRVDVLQERINFLIGLHGNKLSIFGEMTESDLLVRLKILDIFSAESIDMYGLLDHVIKSVPQDPGVDVNNIAVGVAYNLKKKSRNFAGLHVSQFEMKVTSIDITVGASEKIQPPIPALKVDIGIEANGTVEAQVLDQSIELAKANIRDNRIQLEVGMHLNADGSLSAETWMEEHVIDIDVDSEAVIAAIVAGFITIGFDPRDVETVVEFIGHEYQEHYNDLICETFRALVTKTIGQAPYILAVILGDDFTFRSIRSDGDDIVFDYIAPLESEPKPSKNYDYLGVVGRSAALVADKWHFVPPSLGDTWSPQNLNKIDHIVVVMMENRSFDHVLGYRAQLPGGESSDGLTRELISFLESQRRDGFPVGFFVRKLKYSGIPPNALGLKTQFPIDVGHTVDNVITQLGEKVNLPTSSRAINNPKGFIDDFMKKLDKFATNYGYPSPLNPQDVLGYYDGDDLPFYKFLVENYAYCENYYCSHPGPTFPNRMFSLSGDLQYDRTGEAIINNNNGDNFFLSRAMTIFDLLTRKGVGWRVYESSPSVTMLRMFARYAADNTNIVDIGKNMSRLQEDVHSGNLPAVTFIDPAMHHFPANDDHAHDRNSADMYRGQLFLKGVYDTLRAKAEVWAKTMLVITYDEHGGFYDHVIPPIADILMRPPAAQDPQHPGNGFFISGTMMINYGLRVPTFVVSPWTPVGKGPDIVLDHCSILKTILARFCGQSRPFISARVNASRSFDAYLSEAEPRMDVPDSPMMTGLPDQPQQPVTAIVTDPISRKQMRNGNVDYHDLTGMLGRMLGRPRSLMTPTPISEADVLAKLEELAKSNPIPLDWKVSIVDLMVLLKLDSSFKTRQELAVKLGCPAELMKDSAKMNVFLHQTILQKIAQNGGNMPQDLLDYSVQT